MDCGWRQSCEVHQEEGIEELMDADEVKQYFAWRVARL